MISVCVIKVNSGLKKVNSWGGELAAFIAGGHFVVLRLMVLDVEGLNVINIIKTVI